MKNLSLCLLVLFWFGAGFIWGFNTAHAETPEMSKQEMYQQLNEWRKEIVKLRYTEYCASVTPPPAALIAAIQQGVEAKAPPAIEAMKWLEQVMEKYGEKGCGDA